MLNAVIIEDEPRSRQALEQLLQKHCPEINICGFAETVKTGVELVKTFHPELIFLDVLLPDGSGFDVLEQLKDFSFRVIFTTATDKYAVKAIKYSALDYLLKPIDVEELKTAIQKVLETKNSISGTDNIRFLLENLKQRDAGFGKIALPTGKAYEIVAVNDIVRCEANDNYTNVYLADKRKFLVSGTLKHYEDLLPEIHFMRVHHRHLINMNHMIRYLKEDSGYAVMSDGSKVEISRRKKEDFLNKLK